MEEIIDQIEEFNYSEIDETIKLLQALRKNELEYPQGFNENKVEIKRMKSLDFPVIITNKNEQLVVLDNKGELRNLFKVSNPNYIEIYEDAKVDVYYPEDSITVGEFLGITNPKKRKILSCSDYHYIG